MSNVTQFSRTSASDDRSNRNTDSDAAGSDDGHGRRATSPWQIPFRGWKDILVRTYQQFNKDRLLAGAADVQCYGLLALFPAITGLVSSYALFAKGIRIYQHLSVLDR